MILELIVGVALGFAASLAYFRGLWWTVERLQSAKRPALLFVGSFVARSVAFMVFAGLLGSWSLAALIGSPVGFWVGRRVAVRRSMEAPA